MYVTKDCKQNPFTQNDPLGYADTVLTTRTRKQTCNFFQKEFDEYISANT